MMLFASDWFGLSPSFWKIIYLTTNQSMSLGDNRPFLELVTYMFPEKELCKKTRTTVSKLIRCYNIN